MEEEVQSANSIPCPNCGFDIFTEIITTIRSQDTALEELFNGDLNRCICDQCATDFIFETPLVFKSDDLDYFIYYNQSIEKLGWEVAQEQMQKALDASLEGMDIHERPECRLTLNRNDFIEKIALHLADLDDRMVEYLKFHIFSQEKEINTANHILLYDFSRSDKEMIEFNVLEKATGKLLHNTQTRIEMIEQLEGLLSADDCPIELDTLFSGLYVQLDRLTNK
ncbi:MAG: CpXC domain-containing protein [Lentisphaeraceae bacterium]|nr:CpXC domain-containing protein [Lentisphaeraceae bacterium]